MNKLESVFKKFSDAQNQKATLAKEIESFKARQTAEETEAKTAAENGDTDGYLLHKGNADRAGAEAYVREMQLKKCDSPISLEEAQAAWEEFSRPKNKEIEKAFNQYKDAREKLYEQFKNLMDLHRKCFSVRQDLCTLLDLKKDPSVISFGFDHGDKFPMFSVGLQEVQQDNDFFQKIGKQNNEKASGVFTMLKTGRVH